MTTFFIAPFKPAEWRTAEFELEIEPGWYKAQLERDWPGVEFLDESNHALFGWVLPSRHGIGRLHPDTSIVSLDTPSEKFFLWHREVIPKEHRLFLFNESSYDCFELRKGMTYDDLDQFVGINPDRIKAITREGSTPQREWMKNHLYIITGSLPDQNLESLSKEVWFEGKQILQIGRYGGDWVVTFADSVSVRWEDFLRIVGEFTTFVSEEEQAIKREDEASTE